MKAIIVDDEEKSSITLQNMLERHCPAVEIMALCSSVEEALNAVRKHTPSLVFLDIEMPFENGFGLLEKLPDPAFEVIFTTAYDHYAIKAIKFSAMDYLLKPVDADELKAAVKKAENKVRTAPVNYEMLLSALSIKSRSAKIAVPTFDGLQMIHAEDIVKCTADESYTHITLANGQKLVVSRLLKDFEDLLSDLNFFRVHNSSLVNLVHVKKYIKGDGGYVLMSDGESVEVSRRKKTELLNRLARVHL